MNYNETLLGLQKAFKNVYPDHFKDLILGMDLKETIKIYNRPTHNYGHGPTSLLQGSVFPHALLKRLLGKHGWQSTYNLVTR